MDRKKTTTVVLTLAFWCIPALLTGCAPSGPRDCISSSYDLRYQYDDSQRVILAQIIVPEGDAWTIEYTYDTVLLEARVIKPDGSEYGEFLYERDSDGRLIRKRIRDQEGVDVGEVKILYDGAGNIDRVIVAGSSDLPRSWDPIADQ